MLGLPHAALVNRVEISGDRVKAKRELEGGIEEMVDLKLPAVLTIQTGISEPEYVSLAALLEAEDKEMEEVPIQEIGITLDKPLDETIDQVFFPSVGKMAEILKGSPDEVVVQLTEIIKKKRG